MKSISWYLALYQYNWMGGGGFDVPFLFPHLSEGVCEIESADFFCVLEFEELIAAMTGHIY
jgi:hypothetical protein